MGEEPKRLCFVIMPFSDTASASEAEWTDFFENDLKPAVEGAELGYECRRSQGVRGNIVNDILRELNDAHLVIADLTDCNPNVFYELAVRHALSPRTIIITRDRQQTPFDLRPYGCHQYRFDKTAGSHQSFRTEVLKLLLDVEQHPDKADNPVADFLENRQMAIERLDEGLQRRSLAAVVRETNWLAGGLDSDRDSYRARRLPMGLTIICPALQQLLATAAVNNEAFMDNGLNLLHELALDASLREREMDGKMRLVDEYYSHREIQVARAVMFSSWLGNQAKHLSEAIQDGFDPSNVELTHFSAVLSDLVSDDDVTIAIAEGILEWLPQEYRDLGSGLGYSFP